jgi:hypothetical protein
MDTARVSRRHRVRQSLNFCIQEGFASNIARRAARMSPPQSAMACPPTEAALFLAVWACSQVHRGEMCQRAIA